MTSFLTNSSTIGSRPSFEKTEIKADLIFILFTISKIIKLIIDLSLFLCKEFNFVNNMYKRLLVLFFLLFAHNLTLSQDVKGKILELIDNKEMPIAGANIIWSDNSGGTTSDIDGNFILSNPNNLKNYIVSYVGYQNDTLSVSSVSPKIFLRPDTELEEVSLEYNSKSSSVSLLSSANIINISSEELLKATGVANFPIDFKLPF